MQHVLLARNVLWRLFISACIVLICVSYGYASVTQDEVARGMSHYVMGIIHDMHGATEEAIEEYNKAASFDRTNYLIHLRLGADYAQLGKLSEAVEELNLSKKYNDDDLQSRYLLALIYSTQREFDKAANEYESILKSFSKIDPQNVQVYHYLGQLYYSQKKFAKAIEQFKRILLFDPKNAEMMFVIASVYLDMNQRGDAIEYLKKTIDVNPEHEIALNSLGYIYAEDNVNLDEAQKLVEHALAIDPDNGAYFDSLGWVYFRKGMHKKALEYLKKASDLLEDPVIYEHMGDVYRISQDADNAVKYWKLSLKLLPDQKHIIKKIEELQKDIKNKSIASPNK